MKRNITSPTPSRDNNPAILITTIFVWLGSMIAAGALAPVRHQFIAVIGTGALAGMFLIWLFAEAIPYFRSYRP